MAASFAALLFVGASPSAGGNPWNLHCASMPAERPAPAPLRAAALRFFPWVRPAAKALHSARSIWSHCRPGPRSHATATQPTAPATTCTERWSRSHPASQRSDSHGPQARQEHASRRARLLDQRRDGLHRQPPDVSCGSRPLRFARALTIGPHGWRIVQTELRIGRTGCFTVTASGRGLHAVIPLSVPGPDYGTTGW